GDDGRAGLASQGCGVGLDVRGDPVGPVRRRGEARPVGVSGQRGGPGAVPLVRVPRRGPAHGAFEEVHRLPRRDRDGVVAHSPAWPGTLMAHQWRGVIEEYREWLPVTDATPVLTLREGGTPLVRSEALSEATGCEVHLKYEGANPTGSFKDRGMTLAVSKAVEDGA